MVELASVVAVLLFLLPVAVFVTLRAREDSELWEIALDVPIAITIDLYSVMVLAVVLRLDVATLVSRALWLVGGGVYLLWRPSGVRRWPRKLTLNVLAMATVGVVAAVLLSLQVSRPYSIWDRGWHIPLVASLRGQNVPFHNVEEIHQRLFYHYSGDVHAAMLQSTSFAVIHSSLALSLAHDVHFGMIGFMLALLMAWWGHRRLGIVAIGVIAVLTGGPFTLYRGGVRAAQHGYSIINFLSMSFRPHDALGGVLMLGFVAAAFARLAYDRDPPPAQKTAVPLVACAATLALTDETSLGILGLSLGLVWTVWPGVIHSKRTPGVLILGGLALALILPNLIFGGALNPAAQHHKFSIVPWRSPGSNVPSLPLTLAKGRLMLLYDTFPAIAVVVGMTVHWLTRRRSRERGVLLVFWMLVIVTSVVLLTHLDMDQKAVENHRFMLVCEFVAPLLAVLFLAPGRRWEELQSKPSPYAVALLLVGMASGTASTLDWLYHLCPGWAYTYNAYWADIDHYKVDCRREAGARIGTSAEPQYLSKPVTFLYSGCVPVYAPALHTHRDWALTIGLPGVGPPAAKRVSEWLPPGDKISVICPQGKQTDPPCVSAIRAGECHDVGRYVKVCVVPRTAERW